MKLNTRKTLMEAGRCGAQTAHGTPCRSKVFGGQDRCWIHKGPQCSVCLGAMAVQQANRTLPCGHEFHSRCVDRWKRSCPTDPTCPMCREPFDLPTYRCRLIIERVSDNQRAVSNFETPNVQEIVEGFGVDFRALVPAGAGRLYTDIHFDIEPTEALEEILRELGLPEGPHRFG
jgi:hypothetical protein